MADIYVTSAGNDTTGDGSSGNPYASPGKAGSVAVSGDRILLKGGSTYTLTTSSNNVAGGRVTLGDGIIMEGYAVTPGDLGTPPIISAGSVGSITIITLNGSHNGASSGLVNVSVDGNSQTSVVGVKDANTHQRLFYKVSVANCTTYGFEYGAGGDNCEMIFCKATNCGWGFYLNDCSAFNLYGCAAYDCTTAGFGLGSSGNASRGSVVRCIAAGTTAGAGFTGITSGFFQWGQRFRECVAHGNSSHGFSSGDSNDMFSFVDCVATDNGGYGWANGITSAKMIQWVNCAGRNNTSGLRQNSGRGVIGDLTLTNDPWVDGANYDFRLNHAAGGGAVLRMAGIGVYGQTNGNDASAVQSRVPTPAEVAEAAWDHLDRTLTG